MRQPQLQDHLQTQDPLSIVSLATYANEDRAVNNDASRNRHQILTATRKVPGTVNHLTAKDRGLDSIHLPQVLMDDTTRGWRRFACGNILRRKLLLGRHASLSDHRSSISYQDWWSTDFCPTTLPLTVDHDGDLDTGSAHLCWAMI